MLLEVLHEEGGVGEVQLLRHLRYGERSGLQQYLGLGDDRLGYPRGHRLAGDALDGGGEILGGHAHAAGVESHAALAAAVLPEQAEELVRQPLLPGLACFVRQQFAALVKGAHLEHEGVKEGFHHLHAVGVRGARVGRGHEAGNLDLEYQLVRRVLYADIHKIQGRL